MLGPMKNGGASQGGILPSRDATGLGKWPLWPLGLLLLALAAAYAVLWHHVGVAWQNDYLGLSASLEALRQSALHHEAREAALRVLAATVLGLPVHTAPGVLETIALKRLAGLAGFRGAAAFGPAGVVGLVLVAGLVIVWSRYHDRMSRADARGAELQSELSRLDAIVLKAASPDADLKDVLRELLQHGALRGGFSDAVVLRFHPERADDCLEPFSYQGTRLPASFRSVPLALVDPALSAVGEVLRSRQPWHSRGSPHLPLLPGWEAAAEVHPLMVGDQLFGVLLLIGEGSDADFPRHLFRSQVEALLGRLHEPVGGRRMARARDEARQDAERLAQLTHELRTPLGLIKGYAATLESARDRLGAGEVTEFLHTILEEAERLEVRINEVLTMAAWDAQGIAVTPRLVHLSPWAEDLLHRFPPAERHRVRTSVDPRVRVWADPDKLRDAAANIIQNAMKYSRGPIELEVGHGAGRVRIAVRDHGPGVAERDLDRIFDRFYRSHRERPDMAGGTGIGLSIARAVTLAHHGSIHAENAERGGLRVVMELPLADMAEEGVPLA